MERLGCQTTALVGLFGGSIGKSNKQISGLEKLYENLEPPYKGGRGTTKPDYYVSPAGDVIPSNRAEFEYNLSLMEENNGKYIGETSKGPVRVRIEGPHPMDENFNGDFDSDHFVDHFHVERKKNGLTGQWGKGFRNKISLPMSWIGDD